MISQRERSTEPNQENDQHPFLFHNLTIPQLFSTLPYLRLFHRLFLLKENSPLELSLYQLFSFNPSYHLVIPLGLRNIHHTHLTQHTSFSPSIPLILPISSPLFLDTNGWNTLLLLLSEQ